MTTDEFLLELFKEEQTHARHTETQRLEVTKFILVTAGVLVAFMGSLKFSVYCLPFGPLIMLLGVVGLAVTSTYVERFDAHRARARAFRAKIDEMLNPTGYAKDILKDHPVVKEERVRSFWEKINHGVIALGAVCLFCNLIAIWARATTDPSPMTNVQKIFRQLSQ